MTKRLLYSLCTLVVAFGVLFLVNVKASAASCYDYDIDAALEYAQDNWDSGVGLCAEYASKCLNAGGVEVSSTRVCTLYDELLDNDYGKLYKLKLTNGRNGSVKLSENSGKVAKGDPIFYYCNSCGSFEHVVICNGVNGKGYVQDYAHNNAHNGFKQTYTYPHCGTENWTLYSIRMHNSETLFGAKTSVQAPKIESTSNLEKGVYLKWNAIDGASFYNVYRKVPGGSWYYIKSVKTNSYLDTTAQNGKEYTYTVRASKNKVLSPYYAGTTVKFLSQVNFKGVSNSKNGVYISWNANTSADGYYIYRQVNNGKWAWYTSVKNKNITGYTDKNVISGNTYRYRIRAFSGPTLSGYNANGIKSTFLDTVKINYVLNCNEGIKVNWTSVKGATEYRVYRKIAYEKNWKYVGTVSTNEFIDSNVTGGVYYRYTVRAVNNGYLGYYDTAGVLVKCLFTPEVKTITSSSKGLMLEWGNVDGALNYYVYRKVEGDKNWKFIANVKDGTTYTDTDVKDGVTYIYTVKAMCGFRMSAYNKDGFKSKFECSSL